jgi:hypothetical protein
LFRANGLPVVVIKSERHVERVGFELEVELAIRRQQIALRNVAAKHRRPQQRVARDDRVDNIIQPQGLRFVRRRLLNRRLWAWRNGDQWSLRLRCGDELNTRLALGKWLIVD